MLSFRCVGPGCHLAWQLLWCASRALRSAASATTCGQDFTHVPGEQDHVPDSPWHSVPQPLVFPSRRDPSRSRTPEQPVRRVREPAPTRVPRPRRRAGRRTRTVPRLDWFVHALGLPLVAGLGAPVRRGWQLPPAAATSFYARLFDLADEAISAGRYCAYAVPTGADGLSWRATAVSAGGLFSAYPGMTQVGLVENRRVCGG